MAHSSKDRIKLDVVPPCVAIAPRTHGCVWNALNILTVLQIPRGSKFNKHQLGVPVSFRGPSERSQGSPLASLGFPITGTHIFASFFLSPSHFLPTPNLFSPRVSLIKPVVEGYTNSHLICVRNPFTQSPLRSPCLFLEKTALSLLSPMPCPLKFQNPPQIF